MERYVCVCALALNIVALSQRLHDFFFFGCGHFLRREAVCGDCQHIHFTNSDTTHLNQLTSTEVLGDNWLWEYRGNSFSRTAVCSKLFIPSRPHRENIVLSCRVRFNLTTTAMYKTDLPRPKMSLWDSSGDLSYQD
jgi:hypothetical protein